MYEGDERTRTMEIYVNDVLITTWTSSGITTGFETVALGVTGDEMQLIGLLEDSEWLSINEVNIKHLLGRRSLHLHIIVRIFAVAIALNTQGVSIYRKCWTPGN